MVRPNQASTKLLGLVAIILLVFLFQDFGGLTQLTTRDYVWADGPGIDQESVSSNSDFVPPIVLANQPRLHVEPDEIKRNGAGIIISYCVHHDSMATYYTYVYEWTFSDSPAWAELLGYSDHEWDYEPIIAVVPNDGRPRYVYDKGHYRAGSTDSNQFTVKSGTHRFAPASKGNGQVYGPERFRELTPRRLTVMNKVLAKLSRLPFGSSLSLDWACNDSAKVESAGQFSTDTPGGRLPVHLHAIAGIVGGFGLSGFLWRLARGLGYPTVGRFRVVMGIGIVSGIVTGLASGIVSDMLLDNINSLIMSSFLGMFTGSSLGLLTTLVLSHRFAASMMVSILGVVGVSNLVTGLFTSLW